MALGPKRQDWLYQEFVVRRRLEAATAAERGTDAAVRAAPDGAVVTADAQRFGVTMTDWRTALRPKYLAAGWAAADWVHEPGFGNHVRLTP